MLGRSGRGGKFLGLLSCILLGSARALAQPAPVAPPRPPATAAFPGTPAPTVAPGAPAPTVALPPTDAPSAVPGAPAPATPAEPVAPASSSLPETGPAPLPGCNPPCPLNQFCDKNQCFSRCNPPCRAGYACTQSAACIQMPVFTDNSGFPSSATPESEPDGGKRRGLVGLDVTIFKGSSAFGLNLKVTVVAPILRASIPVGRHVTLEPDLPFVYYDVSVPSGPPGLFDLLGPGDSGFVPGNPTFVAKYHSVNQGTDAYLGGGIAFPLAQISQTEVSGLWKALAYSAAWGTRGLWNVWWYYPDALTLFLPVGIRYVQSQGLDLGAEGAVGVLMYTGSGSRDPRGAAQIGGHMGYASSSVEAGLRLRGVRIPGDTGDDHFQGSIEPYVRGLLDHAFFGGGFIMNLDKPVGPLLDKGSIWGLRLEGGARF